MSAEDISKQPRSNVILQAIGNAPALQVAISTIELEHGDYLLLCSDGLTNKVTDQEIYQLATYYPTLDDSCSQMIELAKQRGETGQGSGPARVPDSAQPETAPQARPETAPTAGLRPLPGSARTEQPRAAAPPKPRPAAASPKPPPARRPPNRPLRPPGVPRTWQLVLAVGLLALLIAGGAYALVDSAGGSGATGKLTAVNFGLCRWGPAQHAAHATLGTSWEWEKTIRLARPCDPPLPDPAYKVVPVEP